MCLVGCLVPITGKVFIVLLALALTLEIFASLPLTVAKIVVAWHPTLREH